jgi:5-bromo-4-chloroindolyl phosphate hydrolysis protein
LVAEKLLLDQLKQYRSVAPVVGPLLLFVLPLPLFPAVFISLARGNFVNFMTTLAAILLLFWAGWVTRRGMKRDVEMDRLGWSRIPSRPWKTLGALCSGLAISLCSYFVIEHSEGASVAVGLTTMAGVVLSYGKDRFFSRWARRNPLTSRDREVAEALEEARLKIAGIDRANQQIHNAELNRRVRRINSRAMDILTIIAQDPITLRRSRKFLKVYLDGAQQVTEGYSRIHRDQRKGALEDNFRNVLITIEDTFAEQQHKLMEKDVLDLDVQIEVLTTQLKNEGVI